MNIVDIGNKLETNFMELKVMSQSSRSKMIEANTNEKQSLDLEVQPQSMSLIDSNHQNCQSINVIYEENDKLSLSHVDLDSNRIIN